LELLNSAATSHQNNFSFTQRLRFGLKLKEFQLGLGTDISQMGTSNFTVYYNNGVFLRYEY